jgi:hypothetical protein
LYDQADFVAFRTELLNTDWNICFESDNPDSAAVIWTDTVLQVAKRVIPNKVVTIRPNDKTFFNSKLRRLRRKKIRIHNKAKLQNSEEAWAEFRHIRNEYNNLIQECKDVSEQKKLDLLKNTNLNPKQWWNIASSILNKRNLSSYPPLNVDDDVVTESKVKAAKFNEHFSSFSTLDTSNVQIPAAESTATSFLNDIVVTEQEVLDLIKNIVVSKSAGADGVTAKLLKEAGRAIVPSLTRLFNLALEKSKFPLAWKKANVTPIFKKDDRTKINNYRPVSLLSCTSKLFERVIFKHLFNFLKDNQCISLKQSGFMPGDSTVLQLTHLYHLFQEALENQKDVRVVFCDISKAFDRVWHQGLIQKLGNCGIGGNLLALFQNYLSDRQQRVVIDGQESSWLDIKAGVPQGSVLGPLMFLIYINDITTVVESDIRLFADDTTLYVNVDNPDTASRALNRDLEKMGQWAEQWLIKFSPPKSVTLNISRKRNKLRKPQLLFGGQTLKEVSSHKHLGLTLTENLTWNEHIDNIAVSANKLLDILNAYKYKLDRKTLEKIYFTYIRPKLEYSAITWDNIPQYLVDVLENVQLRAAKIISGATSRTSRILIYRELCWETLAERRRQQRLVTFYKIINGLAPQYLVDTLPESQDQVYNLRNADRLPNFIARTSSFQNSFFPKTIHEWNNLPLDIRNSPTLNIFKNKIKDTKHKPPDQYYAGKRSLAIAHARLRMFCSGLNDHLYSQLHVVDSPECPCGNERETSKHYLLNCTLFTIERQEMLHALQNIGFDPSLPNLLYGSDTYDSLLNITAFNIIQKYIEQTGRFVR